MARMPGAAWKPLGNNPEHQPLIGTVDGIVLHTAVGSLYSTQGYFMHGNGEGYVGTESHFIVGFDGTIWQITDTARTADANYQGNGRLLSIETADMGEGFPYWNPNGSDVPPWLPAQINALARIVAWAAKVHNFPIVRMPNSKSTTRGVGYHRLGIEPWRVDGGEYWSTSGGKVCPGDKRVAQIDQVIARAKVGAAPAYPQFRETSPAVRDMQNKLRMAGYYANGPRDTAGYYGTFTRGAIKRLQLAFDDTKADPDGLIGERTWAHIEALPDEPPAKIERFPALDDMQTKIGALIRAGDDFKTDHPNMKVLDPMLVQWRKDWLKLKTMTKPK